MGTKYDNNSLCLLRRGAAFEHSSPCSSFPHEVIVLFLRCLFVSHTYVGTLIRLFAVLDNGTSVVSLSVLRSFVLSDFLTSACFSHSVSRFCTIAYHLKDTFRISGFCFVFSFLFFNSVFNSTYFLTLLKTFCFCFLMQRYELFFIPPNVFVKKSIYLTLIKN